MKQAVVLFRDAFDPLTRGHLDFAYASVMRLDATVVFAPTYNGIAPISTRVAFLSEMIKKEKAASFKLDFFEAKGNGQYGQIERASCRERV